MAETKTIKSRILEYVDSTHTYIYDGVILPSVTTVLKESLFADKYSMVSDEVLKRAADKGTAVHKAIEDYENGKKAEDLEELKNYKLLKQKIGFECLQNEVPVILFRGAEPVLAGRLDMVLRENGKIGLGDIKRTSALDKMYLTYQLNIYRIAFQQCYGVNIDFLRALHLREGVRKYIPIPINEEIVWDLVKGLNENGEL